MWFTHRMRSRWSTSDAVQARILDAAMDAFISHGFNNTKLTEVAHHAGVSMGSIYHHFGGKDELFSACHVRFRDNLRAAIRLDPKQMPAPGSWEYDYLEAARKHAAECMVFLTGDTPTSFRSIQHASRYYSELDPYLARMMSAVLLEGLRLVCESADEDVTSIIDGTVTLLKLSACVKF